MFVDTALLRMGADFSTSAGTIAQRGGASLNATQMPAGVFGDFAEAESFRHLLVQAQISYANNMTAYHAAFERLAETSVAAATTFTNEDASSATIDGVHFDADN